MSNNFVRVLVTVLLAGLAAAADIEDVQAFDIPILVEEVKTAVSDDVVRDGKSVQGANEQLGLFVKENTPAEDQEQATSSLLLPTVVPPSNSNGTTVLKSTSTTTTSTQSPVDTINNILIRHHVKNPFIAQRKKLFSPGRPRFGAKTRIRQPHLQQPTFKKLSRHTFKPKYFTTTAPRSTSAAASLPSITTFRRTASTTTSGTPTSTKTFYPTPTVVDVTSPAPTTTTTTTTSTTATAAKHHTTTIWVTPPSSSFPHFNPSEVNVEHEDSSNWPTEEVNLLIDQTLDTNTRPDRNINVNQFTDVIGDEATTTNSEPVVFLSSSNVQQNQFEVLSTTKPVVSRKRPVTKQPKRRLPPPPAIDPQSSPPNGGEYEFKYDDTFETQRREQGYVKFNNGKRIQVVEGSYSYVAPNGKIVKMRYIADDKGYRAFRDKSK